MKTINWIRLKDIPVPVLPTLVGFMTLSNIYGSMGFIMIRHITMILSTFVWLLYVLKILRHRDVCLEEYSQTVPGSLHAGFTLSMMLLGSYYVDTVYHLGKMLWSFGLGLHILHILVFTYRNVITNRNIVSFVPSWFITYNGIMVSVVVGGQMNEPIICKILTYYSIGIYSILLPIMIYRLVRVPIPKAMVHTQPIILAPCSLSLVSYFNTMENPNVPLVYALYLAVFLSVCFVILKLPQFFAFDFTPAFAGMTFPMAIGTVATGIMVGFLETQGQLKLMAWLDQFQGFQLYLTTMIIAYVVLQFLILFTGQKERIRAKYP